MAKKKKYDPFRSMEEFVFQKFLDVLIKEEYVIKADYEPETFTLGESVSYSFQEKTKTGVKDVSRSLLLPCTYTPDWYIEWAEKAKGIFIPRDGENWKLYPFHDKGWLDVKGASNYSRGNASVISYPIKMKWLYQVHGIYAQKVVPIRLFEKTFFPTAALDHYTYKKGKNKGKFKFKGKPETLKGFINNLKNK